MKKIKIGRILIMAGAIFFIVENFYFGWNKEAMSRPEEICDIIVKCFFYCGFFFYTLPIWDLYEHHVMKMEIEKKLDTIKFNLDLRDNGDKI